MQMLRNKIQRFRIAVKTGGWHEAFHKVKVFLLYFMPINVVEEVWTPARIYMENSDIPANSYESHYESDEDFRGKTTDIKALAFYLPQFHTFPENDKWWGKGFTEWTNTRKAKPQFPSHYQPREPHDDIGYYDLSDWHVIKKQAEMIKKHGLYGLCIYHYWFSGKRLMEKPVDLLLEHPEIDLKFCLCWANENWTRTWDGLANDILISQKHENDDLEYIIDLKKYIMDPRYIRVNGEPLVLVYRPGVLPDAEKTFRRWKEWAEKNGIGKIRILVVRGCANSAESVMVEGADGEVEFPPAYSALPMVLKNPREGAQIMHYPGYVNEIIAGKGYTENYPHPVYKTAMLGWDCTPRREAFHCWYGFSPEWYYRWLRYNIEHTRKHHAPEDRFIFINAWNEWAEGTYLEPDKMFGYTNLNTTSRALFDMPLRVSSSDMQMISSSPYYDREWYLKTYQDIVVVGMVPLLHFALQGWKEGRSPSAYFPNALYLFFNPDVRNGETCSLVDFISKGLDWKYLEGLVKEFDRIQARSRKLLNVELLIPPAAQTPARTDRKTAVHLHCFYKDMIPEILSYLVNIPVHFDFFISIPEGRKTDPELEKTLRDALPLMDRCVIRVTPNRGRDIAPLLCTFGPEIAKYDYFCHIHTKKSLHTPAHAPWAKFIYDHIFGDAEWMTRVFSLLDNGASIVYPADFLMMREEPSGWGSNLKIAQQFLDRCGKKIDLEKELPVIEFPQGSMFWANVSAMKELFSLNLRYEDFPAEPLGTDGSIAHAMERLFFIWNIGNPGKVYQVFHPGEEELIERKRYWYEQMPRSRRA